MVIYEVNADIDPDIADAFYAWLLPHIQELLRIDGFISAELFVVENPDSEVKRWSVQYRLENREKLQHYLDHYAPVLRQDGIERFGEKYRTSRRIMSAERGFLAPGL